MPTIIQHLAFEPACHVTFRRCTGSGSAGLGEPERGSGGNSSRGPPRAEQARAPWAPAQASSAGSPRLTRTFFTDIHQLQDVLKTQRFCHLHSSSLTGGGERPQRQPQDSGGALGRQARRSERQAWRQNGGTDPGSWGFKTEAGERAHRNSLNLKCPQGHFELFATFCHFFFFFGACQCTPLILAWFSTVFEQS